MANKNDPRVLALVRAWLIYATKNGISTPTKTGKQPEDTDLLEFVISHMKDTHGMTFKDESLDRLKSMVDELPASHDNKQIEYISKVKRIIDKYSTNQKIQLKRELMREAVSYVYLIETTVSPNDVRDIFKLAVRLRRETVKPQDRMRDTADSAREKWSSFKDKASELRHRFTSSESVTLDRMNRLRELSGMSLLNEVSFSNFKQDMKNKFRDRDMVEYDDMFDKWQSLHSPVDIVSIGKILRSFDFTNGEINQIFSKAGIDFDQGADPEIVKVATAIKNIGIDEPALKYLNSIGITESIINEKTLSHASIKTLLRHVADIVPRDDPQPDQGELELDPPEQPRLPPGSTSGTQGDLFNSMCFHDRDVLCELFSMVVDKIDDLTYGRNKRMPI